MDKRWKKIPEPQIEIVASLEKTLGINPILVKLLVQRGIRTFEEAKHFFRPEISHLHDPFLMKGMDTAVALISDALSEQKKIMVYGDYDVDGTSAVALVYGYLKKYEANVFYYIPDRKTEGYGVSALGMQRAIEEGVELLITLDCGIKATNTLKIAKDAGINIIVCDHHLPGDELPPADAILNPKQGDCDYPFKELCGCGVGFKMLQGLQQKFQLEEDVLLSNLDLVAIATSADIVPMVGENRTLTALGLQWINNRPRPGIKAIFDQANKKHEKSVSDLVFTVAPRINAAGRLEHGNMAVALLSKELDTEAVTAAKNLHELNETRKGLDRAMAEEALQQIVEKGLSEGVTTVVYNPDWEKGVVGIVASRLTESYYRPTIVLCKSEEKVTGSVRSVQNFDVHHALCGCADLLDQFGGHKYAAGLSLKEENLHAFKQRFEEVVRSQITEDLLTPVEVFDAELPLEMVNFQFLKILKQMAPFGPEHQEPQFLFENLVDNGHARLLGGKHLKLRVKAEGCPMSLDAIGFNMPDKFKHVIDKKPFRMIASIEENHWNGQVNLQLMIKDIKPVF